MREDQKEEGKCSPEPADLNEPHVEDIALLGKIAGCIARVVRLRFGEVCREARIWVERAEQRAEDEGGGIDGQKRRLQDSGQERRIAD